MNKEEFYNYIIENFTISGEAARLIKNILDYADGMDEHGQHYFLTIMLDGTIGLSDAEIRKVCY
jgi:hypothetical protein